MFDKQYRFLGSHAEKVVYLTALFDKESKAKLFERNIDVYINAPILGFLYNRKATKNSDGNVSAQNVFPEQMINNSDKLKYILQLILLLDSENEPDEEKRVDRAFRTIGQDADLELFDQYVLGGVDLLYEKLIEGATDSNEIVERLYEFTEEFQDRFNSDITNENILELCNAFNKQQ